MGIVRLIFRLTLWLGGLALLAYFGVRETRDRWFLAEVTGLLPPVAEEASEEEPKETPMEEPQVARASETAPESQPNRLTRWLDDPFGTREALAQDLVRAQTALTQALRNRMAERLSEAQLTAAEQAERLQAIGSVLEGSLTEFQTAEGLTAAEAGAMIGRIEESLLAAQSAASQMDDSLAAWTETYRSLQTVGEISSDPFNEANYEFISYEVEAAETLPEIARKLEAVYGVPEADLGALIQMFNQVETRMRSFGSRRQGLAVVANDTLRIPLPKNSARLLEDQAVSSNLENQRTHLVAARSRQRAVEGQLGEHIGELRRVVGQIEAMEALGERLAEGSMLLSEIPSGELPPELNEQESEAWEAFDSAVRAYRQAEGVEARQEAEKALRDATRSVLQNYLDATTLSLAGSGLTNGAAEEPDDLEWLSRFLEEHDRPAEDESPSVP